MKYKELRSRHQFQRKEVTTTFSCRDISSIKDMSRPNKGICNITETTEVATSLRGRDVIKRSRQYQQNGPVNLKSTMRCIEIRAQLQNPINTQLLLEERSSWRLEREIWVAEGSCILIFFYLFCFYFRLVCSFFQIWI